MNTPAKETRQAALHIECGNCGHIEWARTVECSRCGAAAPYLADPTTVEWVAHVTHPDCPECVECINAAIAHARATGATGVSYTDERDAHGATVNRRTIHNGNAK